MGKKFFALSVMVVMIAAALFIYQEYLPAPDKGAAPPQASSENNFNAASFPKELGGNQLAGPVVSGPEALKVISRLHGTNISIVDGYMAEYSGPNKITLWVSQSANTKDAKDLFVIMDKKMPFSQVFTDREELKVDGKQVIKVLGMGQEHYYWYRDTQVYWLAVGGGNSMAILKESLDKL